MTIHNRLALIATLAAGLVSVVIPSHATVFTLNTDPFAGSTALTTPGRQVVGGEVFISFDVATDSFAFEAGVFGVDPLLFANDVIGAIPSSGVNTIVLETFDNDGDPTTAFNAGTAANLIAGQITSPGAGFFIYFNQGLNLPRLVFSPNLDDPTSDLKVLARLTNLSGNTAELSNFTADNFQLVTTVPEGSGVAIYLTAAGALAVLRRLRRPRG